ncbi:acyl-CoA N-acyltransferase [Amniculicola lignicola CBS 123094]|uniref:Acyl-CoA N-acyltransferase n=1 Tax=Amniculicola lignicola CBS 123094 TaxID=1392246 RepID=A0A6A5WHU5_9PLEO|nr:acyl-CoA N-acyltransferase [Amniculicola lignicola CBS 123094]
MPSPPLTTSLLTPSQIPLYQAIRHEAFTPTVNKIIYTREPAPSTQARIISEFQDSLANGDFFLGCFDSSCPSSTGDERGEMIAGAKWRWAGARDAEGKEVVGERTREAVDEEMRKKGAEPYAESDGRAWEKLFEELKGKKMGFMGRRCYYVLDTLATKTAHMGKGAGSLLIRWGVERADAIGVECYLEANILAVPLYERFGFQRVGSFPIDLKEFGLGEERINFVLMIRPAKDGKEGAA